LGFVIIISGVHNAGKSTTIKGLIDRHPDWISIPERTVHLPREVVFGSKDEYLFLRSEVWWFWNTLNNVFKLIDLRRRLPKSQVILAERDFMDVEAYSSVGCNSIDAFILSQAILELQWFLKEQGLLWYDYRIVLDCEAKTAVDRAVKRGPEQAALWREDDIEYAKKISETFRALYIRDMVNATWIDTTNKTIDEMIDEVEKVLVEKCGIK
jgi:hypothetical protein